MANNTVIAKPKSLSAPIYRGAANSANLPTDATTTLNAEFKSIGSISEDGLSEDISRDSDEIKRWGGDVVQVVQTGKTDTFKFTLIDYLNLERQKMTFGDSNVTGELSTGITIVSKSTELEAHSYIIDEILTGNILQRTVIYNAKVTEVGEMKHEDGGLMSQEVTLTAMANSSDITFTRYIVQGTTQSNG